MKSALGMPKGMTGVYVTKTEPLFDAAHQLQPGDVLTHFDGVEIADDGTFLFREAVRIDFRHMVSQAFHGDMSQVCQDLAYFVRPVSFNVFHPVNLSEAPEIDGCINMLS